MRRLAATAIAVLLAACGSSKSDTPKKAAGPVQNVGDPAGMRAFSGSFRTGTAAVASPGTCTVLVPPAGTGPLGATARCATATATVDLTGTYTATVASPRPVIDEAVVQAAGGTGVISLHNTGSTWTISGSIGASQAGVGVLSGTIVASGNSAPLVLTDATVDPVTAFCGTYAADAAPSTPFGAFLLQINSTVAQGVAASFDGLDAFLVAGSRSGSALDLSACDFTQCAPVATGTVNGTASISGRWGAPGVSNPGPTDRGSWSGTPCPGTITVRCCGTGPATRCCIGCSSCISG